MAKKVSHSNSRDSFKKCTLVKLYANRKCFSGNFQRGVLYHFDAVFPYQRTIKWIFHSSIQTLYLLQVSSTNLVSYSHTIVLLPEKCWSLENDLHGPDIVGIESSYISAKYFFFVKVSYDDCSCRWTHFEGENWFHALQTGCYHTVFPKSNILMN